MINLRRLNSAVPPRYRFVLTFFFLVRRALSSFAYRSSKHFHTKHVQFLPLAVHRTHVDHALHSQKRAHRGCGHAVLTGTSLCDDAVLTDALGQEGLSHGIIDFVRPCVRQLLAFQPNLSALSKTQNKTSLFGIPTSDFW